MKIDLDKKRHILKTISWRILGTTDTILWHGLLPEILRPEPVSES